MMWFRKLGLLAAGFVFLAACEQGGAPSATPEAPKTDFGFTKPAPATPGQTGLSGTIGGELKPGAADVNVNANTQATEAKKDACIQDLNSGKKYDELSAECKKIIDTAAANLGSAISGATAAMQAVISSAASAVSSATSSFKMPSISLGSFGSSGSTTTTLPEGCHQDGDVGLAITDPNLRAAVSKIVNKGTASTQITAYDALNLKWLEIPTSKNFAAFSNLDGLQCFINLDLLDVSGHPISSLAPITTLTHLTVLKINNTKVSDLTPIAKLPIVYLHMNSDPGITDLKSLLTMESLKGGLVLALNNPQLKKCQLDDLTKLFKVETNDAYCPNADPNASGCGPCGDNGYECNTKIETKNYTSVAYNESTSCEPVVLDLSGFKPSIACTFNKITLSINVVDAGSGSTVRLEFQDKNGKTLAKSTTYNLNGKNGNRTFDLAMPNTVPCDEVNQNMTKVVFYFTDSGFLDMDYSVQYLYLNSDATSNAWLNSGFAGYVEGDTSSISRAYPADFSGPATQPVPANFGK